MAEPQEHPGPSRYRTGQGPGRLLVAVYGVFAISALARAGFQIGTKFGVAPLAYLLSAFAAAVYVVATWALARGGPRWGPVALGAVLVELVGVVTVGTLTLIDSSLFADDTVWSRFGQGYGYVPLLLPCLGLAWILRTSRQSAGRGRRGERQ